MTTSIQARDLQVGMSIGIFAFLGFSEIEAVAQVSNGDIYYKIGEKITRVSPKQKIKVTISK